MSGEVRSEIDPQDPRLAWLVFDHPERRNAISLEMWRQIPERLDALAADDGVRVVVLRGAGEAAFVAGADISEFGESRTGDASRAYDEEGARAFSALEHFPKPLLAMLHGFCVGGGVAIALCADARYAADDAVFAVPAARLGLGYHVSGIEMLQNLVGPSRTKEIFFTARRFRAAEALDIGLVNDVVPAAELSERVRATALQIAANAPLTIGSVKRIVGELAKPAGERNMAGLEASIRACFESEDYKEGVAAFLAKRAPRFAGR